MSRRRKGQDIHGVFLLDKPVGLSSNQALQKVRRILDARKAGHTGTLDPFATGMLPICLGEASKTAGLIMGGRKSYQASLHLGEATDTGDIEGVVSETKAVPELTESEIESALIRFRGEIEQVPPMYSALKRDGKPLYELARQGIVVEREARKVSIYRLQAIARNHTTLELWVECSKGTYIRTLAEDLSRELGTCGHLVKLRRLHVEPFVKEEMHGIEDLEVAAESGTASSFLLAADAGLKHWPKVQLQDSDTIQFRHGHPVPSDLKPGRVRVYGQDPELGSVILGLGEILQNGKLQPTRVFAAGVRGGHE
jgi:tRNA pseudouridine55 synthase